MSNLQKHNYGAVTVEFAIVVPLLVILVFGITELGRAMYQLNTLAKSTSAGVRYLSRMPDAVILEDGKCSKGPAWDAVKASYIVMYGTESNTGEKLIPNINVTFTLPEDARTVDPGVVACVIIAHSTAEFTSVFGDLGPIIPFTDIDAFTMDQTEEERYIGE